ncbi:MAG: adenine phosphoribosyltransferase, partial [Planctomycetota bacterium]
MTAELAGFIRDVPDFPKKGIVFKDITPLLADPGALKKAVADLAGRFADCSVDLVASVEARGFIFGPAVAMALDAGFVPVRKPGKLPCETREMTYELEYGTDTVQMHADAVESGQKVLLVDDLIATGGTIEATAKLVEEMGGEVVGM